MTETATMPQQKPEQLTALELQKVDKVYMDIVENQGELLQALSGNPDKDLDIKELSQGTKVDLIDAEDLESHNLALRNLNGIINKIESGGFDIRDLPKHLIVEKGIDSASSRYKRQASRLEDIANVIDARIYRRERDGEFADKAKEHNTRLRAEKAAAERKAKADERTAENEIRQQVIEEELGRLTLVHGKFSIDRDPELKAKIEREARAKANAAVDAIPKNDPHSYDPNSPAQQEKREQEEQKKAENSAAYSTAIRDFHKGENMYGSKARDDEIKTQTELSKRISDTNASLIERQAKATKDIRDESESYGFTPFGRLVGDSGFDYYDNKEEPDDEVVDMGEGGVLIRDPSELQPTMPIPVTKKALKGRFKSKLKELWNKQPAVRFDGKDHNGKSVPGNKSSNPMFANRNVTVVDTRERNYKSKHVVALVGAGVLAVGAAYLASKGFDSTPYTGGGGHGSDKNVATSATGAKAGVLEGIKHIVEQAQQSVDSITPNTDTVANFVVERGHGLTNELMEFASTKGSDISGQQAWELHQHLLDKFGNNYLDLKDVANDTYTQAGDVRISSPGSAHWASGVQAEITDWLKKNK